jgi:DNA-binding Lrp family transcriptional regulator
MTRPYPMSAMAKLILAEVKPGVKYSYQEIAGALDIPERNSGMMLKKLAERGLLKRTGTRRYYRYSLPEAAAPRAPALQPSQQAAP